MNSKLEEWLDEHRAFLVKRIDAEFSVYVINGHVCIVQFLCDDRFEVFTAFNGSLLIEDTLRDATRRLKCQG